MSRINIHTYIHTCVVHDSIKPTSLVRREEPNLSQFGGWAVRARLESANGPRVGAAKPRVAADPAKLDSYKFGDESVRPNRWLD